MIQKRQKNCQILKKNNSNKKFLEKFKSLTHQLQGS